MLFELLDGLELVIGGNFDAFREVFCGGLEVGIVILDDGAISAVGFVTLLGEIKTRLVGRNTEEL
jgi:hypothetical protein